MPRRQGYYAHSGPLPSPAPQLEPLVGADAIAAALGIEPKRLYRLIEKHKGSPDAPPIHKVPGLGLSADRLTLLAWWARRLGASAA